MSITGELNITLNTSDTHNTGCQISSSRPLLASRIFTGKTITETLTIVPLLFSICSKAQTVTAIRAIESAKKTPVTVKIESIREALITLENLREQTLRVTMDWPVFLDVTPSSDLLSHIAQGISEIMKQFDLNQTLTYPAPINKVNSVTKEQCFHWEAFSKILSNNIFGNSPAAWLVSDLDEWASQGQTQSASFIYWLSKQTWKNAGESQITHLPNIDDDALLNVLISEQYQFTSEPEWNKQCHELSWFSRKQLDKEKQLSDDKAIKGNGIFSRMVARLVEIADLMITLDEFFIRNKTLAPPKSTAKGLAHSHAARGQLSHYVNVEGDTINKLLILAPTEWNFHPKGITHDSLSNLHAENETELRQQADLLIHAIDPCVGYQLQIKKQNNKLSSMNAKTGNSEANNNA